MNDHIVTAFTDELDTLSADLLRMGGRVEAMIMAACNAAVSANITQAAEIVADDKEVDALEADIERRVTEILARRQPMARDLREVLAVLKISGEVERIGDLSKSIAKRAGEMEHVRTQDVLKGVTRMSQLVAALLASVLDAYGNRDADLAVQVWENDQDIDHHYNSYFREVLSYMIDDPSAISAGAHILFMAKNLERIGDHATNIAEVIYFCVTGEYLNEHQRPKLDPLAPRARQTEGRL